ncbi:S-methyl-5-thioribose-1-phosphate isomerase [Spizellomyces punctatus DAOM BR117]|uniref:Methylthioribose-1-phosphate isomerase n=1 Tax=Spizellomyces punctatus (strain DAOM BR117) TaxID=645134 RepID=A0A0L0H794_SPIPD|nr:S-methyl-5-thioribose-1-phosphate isomerase [Spizellomyces punctatus DAOM BR117]KNC97077.1 S-methyl-5-thioribose-1-phosphate isomerase [Spizellomyces punctatus DAOM BR117]|eukprot:XP_016605117.1 S-methyl-5-thioribose-1-phosphate isomerase [Spizellomyces punctatus DAOM BR117]
MVMQTAPTLEAIRYKKGSLEILDQLLLPFATVFEQVKGVEDGHRVIKTMKVRGAPAIAIVAALSLAVELHSTALVGKLSTAPSIQEFVHSKLEYLKTSRPTAVNLFEAAGRLDGLVARAATVANATAQSVASAYIDAAEAMLQKDIEDNHNIGRFGTEYVLKHKPQTQAEVQVLTHCNTGSLATAGWGTALGIIRDLHASGNLAHAYCTETRPYNQGSRLTAYELVYENIPATLICDDMASALLARKPITAIIVGADRVAANGDTANKIGTYQLAITAQYHNVLFIVAAPSTSIDLLTASGKDIPIEERAAVEVVQIRGPSVQENASTTVQIAAPGIGVWNPAFDVTPASLISAIVTEKGVCVKKPGSDVFDLKDFLS